MMEKHGGKRRVKVLKKEGRENKKEESDLDRVRCGDVIASWLDGWGLLEETGWLGGWIGVRCVRDTVDDRKKG